MPKGRPKGSVNKAKVFDDNTLSIENLPEVMEVVKIEIEERKRNPSVILEEDAGIVFKEGEPYRIIGNDYIKNDEAVIILQTRKVVKEYLKLQELKDKLKRGMI